MTSTTTTSKCTGSLHNLWNSSQFMGSSLLLGTPVFNGAVESITQLIVLSRHLLKFLYFFLEFSHFFLQFFGFFYFFHLF